MSEDLVSEKSPWLAQVEAEIEPDPRGAVLGCFRRQGPLTLSRPFYPADVLELALIHPPGGLVEGDSLRVDIMVKPGAKVLMTSSSAQKVYKARAWQNQAINLTIRGDSMEWLPKETIVFPGAKARFHLNVEVGAKSRFMGWDLISLGAGQNFSRGSFFQELSLSRENRLIFRERGQIFGQDPFLKASLGFWDRSVAGLFWALGRAENDETKLLNNLKSQLINEIKIFDPTNAQNDLAGITVRDGLLLARYLGSSMERAWDWLEMIWRLTRGLWGGADFRPRLWST